MLHALLVIAVPPQESPAAAPDFARDVAPLLADSCLDCHAGREAPLGVTFEGFASDDDARARAGLWLRVRDMLERAEMPPPEAPAADPKLVERALRWLDARLGTGPHAWPLDPGRVTLRRLNRAEYANTIRDLLELDLDVRSKLPPDEVGYGFDNIGDVLALPTLLLEKYAALAEEIAAAALPGPELRTSRLLHFEAEEIECTLDRAGRDALVSLYSNGSVFTEVVLPREGDYVLRALASGDQAGPEPCRMGFHAGRAELGRVDVGNEHPDAAVFELRARLQGGPQRLAASFLNDYYQPDDPDPGQRDRNLRIDWIELEGPLDEFPPTRAERLLFPCGVEHAHTRDCAPRLLKRLATRAWRRPASEVEIARLMPLVDSALAAGDSLEQALRLGVAAILVSPSFLFRSEIDPAPDDPARVHPLSDWELAARLSYFLWSSLPDERLSGLAEQGLLRDRRILADEARRLLRDPRSFALVENFAAQWLQLRSLARASPDPAQFPDFDEELREAMRLETEMFVEAILREGRPIRELLDADFTFLNERLARHYGIANVQGERMRRVRVTDPARGGVLTQASLLTVTSNPGRTSPVKRGKFVLERVLGTPPPPPPPGAGFLDESPEAIAAASLKERLEQHRANPDCAVCHQKMDAMGFALERFGPTGAWRSRDGLFEIDDSAQLPDGREIRGPAGLKRVLLEDHDLFTRTVAEALLTYAVGRGPTDDDRRAVAALVRSLNGRSPSFEDLILALLDLDAFRMRRGETPPAIAVPSGD